jgi:hypothetical protein
MEALGKSLYAAGLTLGAVVRKGPLMSWELRDVADGLADATSHDVLRDFLRKSVTSTEGDRDGLLDLAMAMRDGGAVLGMHARQGTRAGVTASHAFLNAKAQMLGLSRMSPEEAFGADE